MIQGILPCVQGILLCVQGILPCVRQNRDILYLIYIEDCVNDFVHHLPRYCRLNSLPNDKILDWSKLQAFADNKINVNEKLKIVLGRVETLWEKEKMLVTSIFSFSQNVFQGFFFKVVKIRDCVVKT